jgi:hypothetical protein
MERTAFCARVSSGARLDETRRYPQRRQSGGLSNDKQSTAGDRERVVLRAGDVYFQNGAIHNWEPDPDQEAHVVFISLGVKRTA